MTITESLLYSNGGFYTFAELVFFRLLVLVVCDSVIKLSTIAYNVNNNLDEILQPVVCTVHYGKIITRSRLVVKVAVTRAIELFAQVYWYKEKLDRMLKEAEGQYPVLLHLPSH